MKKKHIWKVILLCVLGTLSLAVLLQIGWSGKYTGSDGKYLPITASDSWAHIYNHPVWEETGKEMFSIWGDSSATNLTSFMSIRALSLWCGWNADEIVDGFNGLLEAANKGDFSIHSVYSVEESASNPALQHARLALYRGQPGKPLAIVAAGGGLITLVSFDEYARRNEENAAIPRPATINLIYTDRFLLYNEDGSADLQFDDADKGLHVFAIVGEGDAYGGDWVLDRKIPEMKAVLGDDHVVYHKYPDYPHGSGLGIGTSAEGWMEQAIIFWEEQK